MKRTLSLILSTVVMLLIGMQSMAQVPELTPEQLAQLSALQQQGVQTATIATQSEPIVSSDTEREYVIENIPPSRDELIAGEGSELQIFGRDMFSRENLTFAPSYSIPTPSNYIVSSGDELIVVVWGAAEAEYKLKVSPEGTVSIPRVGVINVGGLSIEAAEKLIKSKLERSFSGLGIGSTQIKVTLGDFRSISVNIVGEALVPGTYTLPSLATIFNALYAAGGVSDIGSLRDIKLYRAGKLVASLDAYDYLLSGDASMDQRLQDGDLVVIAPYSSVVEIEGNVRRPMLYELGREQNLEDIIEYAGGFAGDAYRESITISRRAGGKQLTIHTVDTPDFADFILYDKDKITVGAVVDKYENRVSIEGAVWREGDYELSDRVSTVGELVAKAQGLRDDAFGGRAQIIRTRPDLSLEVIPINIAAILMGSAADVELQSDDKVVVSSINDMNESTTVTIRGEVNMPTTVPYGSGMTLEDIILMGRGLKNSASLARIEIARRVKDQETLEASNERAELFSFTVPSDLELDGGVAEFELEPYDVVFVRKSPGYVEQRIVTITGEVNFDGDHVLVDANDRLSDLVKASGGLTEGAYVDGASLQRIFTETDAVRERSLSSLSNVAKREALLRDQDVSQIVDTYTEVGSYYTVGIDLRDAIDNPGSEYDLVLRAGDLLNVPSYSPTVTISGAVYYPTTTTYHKNLRVSDYIKNAGGYSSQAKRKPFVIEMNGMVKAVSASYRPKPGSQIVVPYRPYVEPMTTQGWISISTSVVSMAAMLITLFR